MDAFTEWMSFVSFSTTIKFSFYQYTEYEYLVVLYLLRIYVHTKYNNWGFQYLFSLSTPGYQLCAKNCVNVSQAGANIC